MTARDGRQRLDKSLISTALSKKEQVHSIVLNHLLKSCDDGLEKSRNATSASKSLNDVAQQWSHRVWTFLEALRSAAGDQTAKLVVTDDHSGSPREWKLKDESECMRVMYREGPVGSPFHTLCLDGILDGGIPSALAVGWETPFYKEWWPQFLIPTFKITESCWVKRIRVGEDLSLLRFKVPWPLASREILMTAFELEYFEEDIIIVLLDSAPVSEEINEKIHGFGAKDFPALPQNVVRMDMAGGFVMQKMTNNQFFFRTVIDVDMKLDLVPPWVINFISRQLAGHGYKLYQKAVLAVEKGVGNGKVFRKIIETEPMYDRVKLGLNSTSDGYGSPLLVERVPVSKESTKAKSLQGSMRGIGNSENNRVVPYPVNGEISLESENPLQIPGTLQAHEPALKAELMTTSTAMKISEKVLYDDDEERAYDDPEVEWALEVLSKMISYSHAYAAEYGPSKIPEAESKSQGLEISSADAKICNETVTHDGVHVVCLTPQTLHEGCGNGPSVSPVVNKSVNAGLAECSPLSPKCCKIDKSRSCSSETSQAYAGDTDKSASSRFQWTSEIEVVSSADDTDAEFGTNNRIYEQGEIKVKQKSCRYRWLCFSPKPSPKKYLSQEQLGRESRLSNYKRSSSKVRSCRSLVTMGQLWNEEQSSQPRQGKGHEYEQESRLVTLGELLLADDS